MKLLFIILISFLISGCDVFDSNDIKLKKLEAQTKQDMAALEVKKELASIEKEKELEKITLQAKVNQENTLLNTTQELKKITLQAKINQESSRLNKEKELELFEQNLKLQEQQNELSKSRYLMFLAALVIIIISFFIFYYFKKRHENKLKSYEDNLKKYLQQKENDSRNRIAEKLIDTIASGKLDKSQEATLLTALSGQVHHSEPAPLQLEDLEAEIEEVKEIT